jgi:hypothetical protein
MEVVEAQGPKGKHSESPSLKLKTLIFYLHIFILNKQVLESAKKSLLLGGFEPSIGCHLFGLCGRLVGV